MQKEQLAAIFKLMKDNKETFGEMSDGDMQEQLRLYDMQACGPARRDPGHPDNPEGLGPGGCDPQTFEGLSS